MIKNHINITDDDISGRGDGYNDIELPARNRELYKLKQVE